MPIYEYFCENCCKTFEKLMMASDKETPACPCCGSNDQVKRQLSAVSFSSGGGIGSACVPKGGFS